MFWHNLARMTWSLTGSEAEVLLKHRKHNNYPSLGTFALAITWQDGYLREVWERGYNMTILRRVLDALDDAGSLTLDGLGGDQRRRAQARHPQDAPADDDAGAAFDVRLGSGREVLPCLTCVATLSVGLSLLLSPICRRLSVNAAPDLPLPQVVAFPERQHPPYI